MFVWARRTSASIIGGNDSNLNAVSSVRASGIFY